MTKQRILHVPVAYAGQYLPNRRSNPRTYRFRADVPVMLADLSENEAPVAIELDAMPGALRPIDLRWDGIAFWRPLFAEDGVSIVTAQELEARVSAPRDPIFKLMEKGVLPSKTPAGPPWLDWPFPRRVDGSSKAWHEDPFRMETREDIAWEWYDDDLEQVSAKAQQKAKDVALIGGALHLRVVEPYLELQMGSGIRLHPFLPHAPDGHGSLSTSDFVVRHRLDRLADLEQLHRSFSEDEQGLGQAPGIAPESIRILIPECLRMNELEPASRRLFGHLLDLIGRDLGKLSSSTTVRLWCDLKDEAAAHASGDPEAFLRGMEIFARMTASGFAIDATRHPHARIDERGMRFHVASHDLFIKPSLQNGLMALVGATL